MSAPITEQARVVTAIIGQPWSIHAERESNDVCRLVKTVSATASTKLSATSPQATRARDLMSAHQLASGNGHGGSDARPAARCRRERDAPADRVDAVAHVGQPGTAAAGVDDRETDTVVDHRHSAGHVAVL